ncbi:nitrous oxide reductase family maturation protein NosD [Nitrosophilus alvini]|uniref:nitrous oxide reductase family maturation protein NosD n=1 Tax=Nitrosophilus alvini TaxID=2714855 RepID=UPI00190B0571|nr:nitrous oxide reductase family maturation protein NosD [Nitrosophilus alvini]
MKSIIALLLFFTFPLFSQTLQKVIESVNPGAKITLPKGVFKGPILIDKPLILEGSGFDKTVIEGDGKGSVITVTSPYVTIKDLTVRGSGSRRDRLNSAIKIEKGDKCTIENCKIYDSLFGITLTLSNNCLIKGNLITSNEDSIPNRGDGIRLWNAHNNKIIHNKIEYVRDLSAIVSHRNIFQKNSVTYSRYGLYLDHCKDTNITDNHFGHNLYGTVCMGSKNILIKNNFYAKTYGDSSAGIVLGKGKKLKILNNTITGSVQAIYIDSSAAEKGMQRWIMHNRIAFNNEAFHFHAVIKNNVIKYNNIEGNLDDVVINVKGKSKKENEILLNYWDRYEGFDKDGDGIGDIPHIVMIYADQLWQFDHRLKFFYATPTLSLLNFLGKLAPFSEPVLLLQDTRPKIFPYTECGAISH